MGHSLSDAWFCGPLPLAFSHSLELWVFAGISSVASGPFFGAWLALFMQPKFLSGKGHALSDLHSLIDRHRNGADMFCEGDWQP
jgi:hypothetical protein